MAKRKEFTKKTVSMTTSSTSSTAFTMPDWAVFVGVHIPDMTDGNLSLHISTDATNYYPLLDAADGDDLLVCKTGSDPGWVDISDFLRFISPDMTLKLVSSTQPQSAETFDIRFAG